MASYYTSGPLGALDSSALTHENDAGRVVAAAPSLVDVRMDERWHAVSPVWDADDAVMRCVLRRERQTSVDCAGRVRKA